MPFKSVRVKKTPFGRMFHKHGLVGENLLVTKNGAKLRLNFPRIMRAAPCYY